jgi:polar amino acid transport system substrate-binding protein
LNKGEDMIMKIRTFLAVACAVVLAVGVAHAADPAPPAPPTPGQSKRVDQIRQRGELRVGALGEYPWLKQNVGGEGAPFVGPAWEIATEYAKLLGVKLVVVPVSHETKVAIVETPRVDMSIAPLAETPEREKVVDFVIYSKSSLCLFGLASNPKLKSVTDFDELNRPDITVAYFIGQPSENWLPKRLPKAKMRGVTGSGSNAPVDEVLSHRADVSDIDNVAWPELNKSVPGLIAFPSDCVQSDEFASPLGLVIDKGQPVYLAWLRAVAKSMEPQLQQSELQVMKGGE